MDDIFQMYYASIRLGFVMLSRNLFSFIVATFLLFSQGLFPSESLAQSAPDRDVVETGVTPQTSNSRASQPKVDPGGWRAILDSAYQALSRDGITDSDLENLGADVSKIAEEAALQADISRKEVQLIQQRINALGPVPGEGQTAESRAKQDQRELLNEAFSQADGSLRLAQQTLVRAEQLGNQIGAVRYDRFFRSITLRSPGIFQGEFWVRFVSDFDRFWHSLSLLIIDSPKVFLKAITNDVSRLPGLLLLPLVVLGFLRIRAMLQKISAGIPQHRNTAPVLGFIFYLLHGVLPAMLLIALHAVTDYLEVLTPRLDELLFGIVVTLGFFVVFMALVRVFFAPDEPVRRIAKLSDLGSIRIYKTLFVGLAIASFVHVLNVLSMVIVAPIEKRVGFSLIFGLIIALTSLRVLFLYREDTRHQKVRGVASSRSTFWRVLLLALWLASIAIFASVMTGYVALGEFLSQQLLFGVIVVLSAWLLLRFIDYVFLHLPIPLQDLSGENLASQMSEPRDTGQAAILAAGLLKLTVYVAAGILLLLPWGYRTSDFFQIFQHLFFGFEVGGLSISISTILLAFGLFILGYTVTIALKRWLNNKLLPTTSLDIGISNSIATVFGYVGILIAAMLAISAAGFDLSNLAIVAGALSVGVGFGIQSIVNNFVSGLILLAERPIKAGDWVSTSGGDGYVRKISVRSTEIETFDRATIIVPNSSLMTESVTNWTHGNKMGRIIIPVGVGYDSDPDQVKEILLQCAKDHKIVLGRPEPVVYFMDFGASSLDFQLRCFLADINYSMSVQSDLRFSMLRALRQAGIEIPFPQREVLLKNPEPVAKVPTPRRTRSKPEK